MTKRDKGGTTERSARREGAVPRLAALALAVAVPFAAYHAVGAVTESRLFMVRTVEIAGLDRVSVDEVERAAGLERPRNVLTVDPTVTREAVEALDWVRTAAVEVSLDGRVSIVVEEREERALVLATAPVLIDTRGEVIRQWRPGDPTGLPVLTGMLTDTPAGLAPDAALVRRAFAILDRLADALDGGSVSEIQHRGPHGYLVVLDDGLEVRLGADRLDERIERLGIALAELSSTGRNPTYVVLDGESLDRVAVGVSTTTDAERAAVLREQ